MITFPIGTDVQVKLAYEDETGNPVTPTAASYWVLDGDGNVLVSVTTVDPSAAPTITIPATYNQVVGPRSVMLSMTTTGGVIVTETIYGITTPTRLTFLQNSFMSYSQAQFQAMNLPNITDFQGAARADQELALIESFRRLINLNYVIPWPELVDVQNYLYPRYAWEITPRMWPNMTPDLFARYPDAWHQALRNAQVVEADQILAGDQMGEQQRTGLLAWSVGESKMMFKSGIQPLRKVSGMSRPSLEYLKGWLSNRLTLARSS